MKESNWKCFTFNREKECTFSRKILEMMNRCSKRGKFKLRQLEAISVNSQICFEVSISKNLEFEHNFLYKQEERKNENTWKLRNYSSLERSKKTVKWNRSIELSRGSLHERVKRESSLSTSNHVEPQEARTCNAYNCVCAMLIQKYTNLHSRHFVQQVL